MNLEDFRYVILGMIDGILAILGIIVGTFVMNAEPRVIVGAGLGGAFALAMTNSLGSYLAETAVEYGKLANVEKSMMKRLKGTLLEKEVNARILRSSMIHGGFSFMGSLIPLLSIILIEGAYAVYASIAVGAASLAVLGCFSGRVAKTSIIMSCVKMVGLGLLVALVTSLLGYI